MQTITISGNLGRDSEFRRAGDNDVLSFSIGVKQGYGDKASSNWFRCSLWGKRGDKLVDYLKKGAKVVVQGDLTIGEYDGKPQYDVRVNEVEFMSRADGERRDGPRRDGRQQQTDPFADLDDDVGF